MQVFFSRQAQAIDSNSFIAVLGTGGTIAGRASSRGDHVGYKAGEVCVADLVGDLASSVQTLDGHGVRVLCQQVAQIDSKDADWAFLWALAAAVSGALAKPHCQGVVVTHGTDTLEESAWFLACVLGDMLQQKPVVLTCAMRPASALVPDGPQNLVDALTLAAYPGACGVQVCVAGASWSARSVQKVHPYKLAAFDGGDVGPIAYVEAGRVRPVVAQVDTGMGTGDSLGFRYSAAQAQLARLVLGQALPNKPWVELIVHTSAASQQLIGVLQQACVKGLVVQTTGNGTVNASWLSALKDCIHKDVAVWCATRCQAGHLVSAAPPHNAGANDTPATMRTQDDLAFVPSLSGVKVRISMMLWLLNPR